MELGCLSEGRVFEEKRLCDPALIIIDGLESAMSKQNNFKLKLKGELKILLASALISEIAAIFIGSVAYLMDMPVDVIDCVVFGAITTILLIRWIKSDAQSAYESAVVKKFIILQGVPIRISYIAERCPKWPLVLLHIQLNPSLIDENIPLSRRF